MFAFTLIFSLTSGAAGCASRLEFCSILSDKVDRRREWHAKFNQGVIGRSLVKSCNQGENVALTCGYNLMIF